MDPGQIPKWGMNIYVRTFIGTMKVGRFCLKNLFVIEDNTIPVYSIVYSVRVVTEILAPSSDLPFHHLQMYVLR